MNVARTNLLPKIFRRIQIVFVATLKQGGDGGIYVGSIMKGGAIALDGRIEPGDMILQVNDINSKTCPIMMQ